MRNVPTRSERLTGRTRPCCVGWSAAITSGSGRGPTKRAAGARAARGPVLPCAPTPRPEVDGEEAQLTLAAHDHDVGPPPIEGAAVSQGGEVCLTPVVDAMADGEAGREATEERLGTFSAGAIRTRHRAGRDFDVPLRCRKHAPHRRLVLHFLEGDDVGIERLHLPRDCRIVRPFSRNAALEVRVLQKLEIPRGDPQPAGLRAGAKERQHQQRCDSRTSSPTRRALAAIGLACGGIVECCQSHRCAPPGNRAEAGWNDTPERGVNRNVAIPKVDRQSGSSPDVLGRAPFAVHCSQSLRPSCRRATMRSGASFLHSGSGTASAMLDSALRTPAQSARLAAAAHASTVHRHRRVRHAKGSTPDALLFPASPAARRRGHRLEIILVDNGSPNPLDLSGLPQPLPRPVRLVRVNPNEALPSPVRCINAAVRDHTTGERLMICIDGARLASMYLVRRSVDVLTRHPVLMAA